MNSKSVKQCDEFILNSSHYDPNNHIKEDTFAPTSYMTLPTFIRNAIDHPKQGRDFEDSELQTSIELLIKICKEFV